MGGRASTLYGFVVTYPEPPIEVIVRLLREYDLTDEDKNEIYNMVEQYLKERKYE